MFEEVEGRREGALGGDEAMHWHWRAWLRWIALAANVWIAFVLFMLSWIGPDVGGSHSIWLAALVALPSTLAVVALAGRDGAVLKDAARSKRRAAAKRGTGGRRFVG